MDAELQEMLDHHRIRQVLAEYCRGSDRCDEPLMASVYAKESWDDHGLFRGPGDEFARAMTAMTIETTETLSHSLGQSLITVNGDEAGAETYFIAVARTIGPDDTLMCNQLGGRFVDKLVREDGHWKVKHRIAMRDWSVAIPLTNDWELSTTLTPGTRSETDPSYAVLGTARGTVPA
jgi:hypothetical protein